MHDPCDSWQYPAANPRYVYLAVRPDIVCFEGFTPQNATPDLAKFLPFVRTDFGHWSHDLEWTLESGPDDAPSSIDILIPYNYRGATADSWTNYGGQPGDPAEVETGTAMYFNAAGEWCEVNLTEAETERVELHIYENPPEVDFGDDW